VLGFYLPAERKRFLRVMPRARPADGG
jgi:hypothetical protein